MKVKIVTSLSELPKFDKDKPLFSDIETQGLYINTRLVQMYQPSTDDAIYLFDLAPIGYSKSDYPVVYEELVTMLKELWLVFYNGSYDLGTMNFVPTKLDDLFYAVKTAYCEFMEFSLDKVIEKLGYGNLYKDLDKKTLQKQGFVLGAYLSQAQLKYAATDVYVMAKMWEDKRIQDIIQNNLAYKVDMLSQKYALQYQQNGLVVDLETRNTLLGKSIADVGRLTGLLPTGFNPNSYVQVREYLGITESDHEALVAYALSDKLLASKAKVIIDLKKAKKEVSYLQSINFKKMYTKFNVAGAATGRFTSSGGDLDDGFNSQQIPRQFQKLFKADTEDTTVIGLDYSTLELRLACAIFGEPEMYRQLQEGEDIHTSMAAIVTGKTLHADGLMGDKNAASGIADVKYDYLTHKDRTDAKAVNFGYVFGMSAATYQSYAFTSFGVEISLPAATALRDKYFSKYPKFKEYHNYVWNNYKKPKFFYETALGRRVKPKLGTDGINGPVQGTGAETTKLAVHYLIKDDCERMGLNPTTEWHKCEAIQYIFNVVHDAIYMRVPKALKAIWVERLAKAMVKGWEEISKTPLFKFKDIPMPVGE